MRSLEKAIQNLCSELPSENLTRERADLIEKLVSELEAEFTTFKKQLEEYPNKHKTFFIDVRKLELLGDEK